MNKSIFNRTLNGQRNLVVDNIDVNEKIRIDADFPTAEEVLVSDITTTPTSTQYKALTPSMIGLEDLTAGTNITYTSGDTTYNGVVAQTINSTDTTYSAGNGIDLTGTTFSTDNDGTTINNSGGGSFDQNQVLKVPNDLTAGTNIQFVGSSGPTASYNGNDATTINNTQTDTTYQGGANITIDTTTNPDTIDLDEALTGMTGITFTGSGGNNLTGGGGGGGETIGTYLDLTSATNIFPSLYPNNVSPYLVCDVYDPATLDYDSLTTTYAQIFSGNLSNNFVAQTTSVLVELQIFNNQSSGNRWFYLRLSDDAGVEWSVGALVDGGGTGTGTRDTSRLITYADETDDQLMNQTWYLQGLSIGTTYTINPYTRTSSTYNYIYAGGSYPACILKITNI